MNDFILPPSASPLRRIPFARPGPAAPKASLSPGLQKILCELLDATIPIARNGESVFKPIWVHEAMHRSILLAHIIHLAETRFNTADTVWDMDLARNISSDFRDLAAPDDRKLTLIRESLLSLTTSLAKLFHVSRAEFSCVNAVMPAYRRRAAVLAAANMMLSWILFTLSNDSKGAIRLNLSQDDLGFLQLRAIATPALPESALDQRVMADLVNVLNGRLRAKFKNSLDGYIEISFPSFS